MWTPGVPGAPQYGCLVPRHFQIGPVDPHYTLLISGSQSSINSETTSIETQRRKMSRRASALVLCTHHQPLNSHHIVLVCIGIASMCVGGHAHGGHGRDRGPCSLCNQSLVLIQAIGWTGLSTLNHYSNTGSQRDRIMKDEWQSYDFM